VHHPSNASHPISESLEPVSNVTIERDRSSLEQPVSSFWKEKGMKIDESEEQRCNVPQSINESLEPDSNVERDLPSQKPPKSGLTEDGWQIEEQA
jgi:hypothetical protein